MHPSVEGAIIRSSIRCFRLLADCPPRWKLHGFRDKHLLASLAERWLPSSVYRGARLLAVRLWTVFSLDPEPAFVAHSWRRIAASHRIILTWRVHNWRRAFRRAGWFPSTPILERD